MATYLEHAIGVRVGVPESGRNTLTQRAQEMLKEQDRLCRFAIWNASRRRKLYSCKLEAWRFHRILASQ